MTEKQDKARTTIASRTFNIARDQGKKIYAEPLKDAKSVNHKKALDKAEELSIQRELDKLDNFWDEL